MLPWQHPRSRDPTRSCCPTEYCIVVRGNNPHQDMKTIPPTLGQRTLKEILVVRVLCTFIPLLQFRPVNCPQKHDSVEHDRRGNRGRGRSHERGSRLGGGGSEGGRRWRGRVSGSREEVSEMPRYDWSKDLLLVPE